MSPIIPQYNSQRNIQPRTAEPLRQEAAAPFQNIQKLTATVAQISDDWSRANDVMQTTEANAKYKVSVADIQGRAKADPDYRNSEQYAKELSKAKRESLEGISNQQVSDQLSIQFDYDNQIAMINIDSDFKQKQLDYNKVNLKTGIDALLQEKLATKNPNLQAQKEAELQNLLNASIQTGVITPEEARKMLKESQKTSVLYEIASDQSTQEDKSELLKELKDPKGNYNYLDPKTRLQMVEESQRRIFQNNQTYKREAEVMRNEKFDTIFQKINDDTLTLVDIDNQMAIPEDQGGIPKKQLLSIKKGLQKRIKNDLEVITENSDQAKKYLDSIDNFISDENDRQKAREFLANSYEDMILSPKEALFLNSLRRETEDVKFSRTPYFFKNVKDAVSGVRAFFRGRPTATEEEAAMAIKRLLNESADGKNVETVKNDIIKEDRVKTVPDIQSLPENGQRMLDPVTGVEAIVYPDGRIEAVK